MLPSYFLGLETGQEKIHPHQIKHVLKCMNVFHIFNILFLLSYKEDFFVLSIEVT